MNSPVVDVNTQPFSIIVLDKDNNKVQLTNEHFRILRECTREGIQNRAVPFGVSFGFTAFLLAKSRGKTTLSSLPFVVFSSLFGSYLGFSSYSSVCRERLMKAINDHNPNSYPPEDVPFQKDYEMFVQSKPTDIEIPKMSDFDTVNNNLEMGTFELPPDSQNFETPKHHTTYNELRVKNRREHFDKMMQSEQSQPNHNYVQPGYSPTQSRYSPFAQFKNSETHSANDTHQPNFYRQSANQMQDRVPVQPVNLETTPVQGFGPNLRQQKSKYGDDF